MREAENDKVAQYLPVYIVKYYDACLLSKAK